MFSPYQHCTIPYCFVQYLFFNVVWSNGALYIVHCTNQAFSQYGIAHRFIVQHWFLTLYKSRFIHIYLVLIHFIQCWSTLYESYIDISYESASTTLINIVWIIHRYPLHTKLAFSIVEINGVQYKHYMIQALQAFLNVVQINGVWCNVDNG